MDKIFECSKDLHVVATVVYNGGEDEYAYKDAGCTEKFTTSELKDVFTKGALINIDDVLYKAVSFSVASKVGTINYVKSTTVSETTTVSVEGLKSEADAE